MHGELKSYHGSKKGRGLGLLHPGLLRPLPTVSPHCPPGLGRILCSSWTWCWTAQECTTAHR